jgi:very-short-patch-repair endonuclease
MASAGWTVLRFAWEHVMFDPGYVDRSLRSAVGLLTRKPLGPALDVDPARRTA